MDGNPQANLICSRNDVINAVAGQPSELVEFTRGGVFGAERSVDPNLDGSFGVAFGTVSGKITFAAVDDNTSSLEVRTVNEGNRGRPFNLALHDGQARLDFLANPGVPFFGRLVAAPGRASGTIFVAPALTHLAQSPGNLPLFIFYFLFLILARMPPANG